MSWQRRLKYSIATLQPFFWLPAILLNAWCVLLVWDYFRGPISIFLSAALLSFILGLPVRLLERWRVPRLLAVLLILAVIVAVMLLVTVTLLPILINQVSALANTLPQSLNDGFQQFQLLEQHPFFSRIPLDLRAVLGTVVSRLSEQLQALTSRLLELLLGVASGALQTMLTLVISFYLLLRGEEVWDGIYNWLPIRWRSRARSALELSFRNYLLSQLTIAFLIGSTATIVLLLLGLRFWLLLGCGIGLLAIFPFGGSISIVGLAIVQMFSNPWLGIRILVFCWGTDQLIENLIAPRLFGKSIGVHPVWVLMAILIGAQLGGLLGVILAVPTVGCLRILLDDYRVVPT